MCYDLSLGQDLGFEEFQFMLIYPEFLMVSPLVSYVLRPNTFGGMNGVCVCVCSLFPRGKGMKVPRVGC